MLSTDSLNYQTVLAEICESHLVRDYFLPEKLFQNFKHSKKQFSRNSIIFLVSSRIGLLLSVGLNKFPVLRVSKFIQNRQRDLLAAITDHLRSRHHSSTGTHVCIIICVHFKFTRLVATLVFTS